MTNELLTKLGEALVTGDLTNQQLLQETKKPDTIQILPNANVIKIGGQSFIDRGRQAVFPLLEELKQCIPHHKMIIGTGDHLTTCGAIVIIFTPDNRLK